MGLTMVANFKDVFAVILAGGQSSRLYPFNKVLSDLTGSGKSLIQQAYGRLSLVPRGQRYVLTTREMVAPIRRQLKLAADHFFVDPARRGTWPAMLWAMAHLRQGYGGQAHLRRKNADAVIAVMTGDHVIPKVKEFQKAFRQAVRAAAKEPVFVVIPVKPSDEPEEWVHFGSIKADEGIRRRTDPAQPIIGFEEKPSLERAGQMIEEGGWFWNAGMFFFRISVAEAALQACQPAMCRIYRRMSEAVSQHKVKLAAKIFEKFPEKISHPLDFQRFVDNTIDYAIMMPVVHQPNAAASAWVARQALSDWADLGQWTALRQIVRPDRQRNTRIGRVRTVSTTDCILVAGKGCSIQAEGLKNFVVAFSGKEALVLPEKDVPRIKELARQARAAGRKIVVSGVPNGYVRIRGRSLIVSSTGVLYDKSR